MATFLYLSVNLVKLYSTLLFDQSYFSFFHKGLPEFTPYNG